MSEGQPLQQEQELPQPDPSPTKKCCKFPKFTIEKILRLGFVAFGTGFMIVNYFYGNATPHYVVYCLDDMSHNATVNINNYFFNHTTFNYILKAIFSILIDISIIYTFIVWSLFSNNLRFLTSIISYMFLNILVRFIHKTVQPVNSAFTENHLFSIFVNYQITTYSFYSVVMGIIIICAFEWKRSLNEIFFWFFIILFFIESIIMIFMHGHYFHEIFTAWVMGHYLFIMNEKLLSWIFGKDYIKIDGILKEDDKYEKKMDELTTTTNSNKDELQVKAEEAKHELLQNKDD